MKVLVIGGGPAGMMAAGRAASLGAQVTLIEKNSRLGEKLLISGGGRCNFTNAEADIRALSAKYEAAHKALLSPLTKFSASECLEFFASRGMPWKVEANQRAFPASNAAASVLAVLEAYLKSGRVTIRVGQAVRSMQLDEAGGFVVTTDRQSFTADRLILATGGTSHPETGSTGDGFAWLGDLGHRIRYPEPSLVPIAVREKWVAKLQGIALADAGLLAWTGPDQRVNQRGKLLFTHFGLSGPLALNLANEIAGLAKAHGSVRLGVDLFPGLDNREVDRLLLDRASSQPAKFIKNALGDLIPPRLGIEVISQSKVGPETRLNQLTRDQRQAIVATLKALPLHFSKLMDESWAVISSGGLPINEIDWRTMTSKVVPNLAVVGDLLDINRPSGGYSLQLCWSTGWVAGTWAASPQSAEKSPTRLPSVSVKKA